jgi:hypothetical protein
MTNKSNLFSKLFIFVIILLNSTLIISCQSRTVKPKPDGNWNKCHACKGYGTIESVVLNQQKSKIRDKKKDKEDAKLYGDIIDIISDNNKAEQFEKKVEKEKSEGTYEDPFEDNRSMRTKLTKCNICNGLGWVESSIFSSSLNLIGNWQGASKNEFGGFIFKADKKVDMFKNGKSITEEITKNRGDLIYTVDVFPNPRHLDIIAIDNSGTELGRLKMIFEYINYKTIRVRTFLNNSRPNDFQNCSEKDTIILNKVD